MSTADTDTQAHAAGVASYIWYSAITVADGPVEVCELDDAVLRNQNVAALPMNKGKRRVKKRGEQRKNEGKERARAPRSALARWGEGAKPMSEGAKELAGQGSQGSGKANNGTFFGRSRLACVAVALAVRSHGLRYAARCRGLHPLFHTG